MIRTRAPYHIGGKVRPLMRLCASTCALACAAVLGGATPAFGATDCSSPLSTCINDDTLWPHAGFSRFESVGGIDTVAPHQIGFGLVSTYLSRPIVLHLSSPGGPGTDADAINDQGNGTFLWSYGVTRRLELDVALPLTYGQGGTGLAPATQGPALNDTAVRDMRFGFTLSIARATRWPGLGAPVASAFPRWDAGLAARFEVSAPTGDRDQFAGERAGVFVPSVAAQARAGRFFAGAEVGLRLRPTAQIANARIGSQAVVAGGLGVDVLADERLAIEVEAWAMPSLVAEDAVFGGVAFAGGPLVPAEWQASLRTALPPERDVAIQLGGGSGLSDAITTPRLRFVLSIRWAPHGEPTPPRTSSP